MPFKLDAIPTSPIVIPGQLMKHAGHLPSFNCVMYDAVAKTDDRVEAQRLTHNGEEALRFRFKSEVGGPFGKVANPWWSKLPFVSREEAYSDYYVFLTASGKLFLKSTVENDRNTYIMKSDERMRTVEIIAGALQCYSIVNRLPAIGVVADEIYAGKSTLQPVAGVYLPEDDAVEAQEERTVWYYLSRMAENGFVDAYAP